MIFVTVGTHEQGMDRLLIELDRLIENSLIESEVIAQIGYSDYKPKNYKYKELISYDEMDELVKKADIVITHGGPGSIFHSLKYGKIPIVVPRNPAYNEHVDNHQILFTNKLEQDSKVIGVYDIGNLHNIIREYETVTKNYCCDTANTMVFNKEFDLLVKNLFQERTIRRWSQKR